MIKYILFLYFALSLYFTSVVEDCACSTIIQLDTDSYEAKSWNENFKQTATQDLIRSIAKNALTTKNYEICQHYAYVSWALNNEIVIQFNEPSFDPVEQQKREDRFTTTALFWTKCLKKKWDYLSKWSTFYGLVRCLNECLDISIDLEEFYQQCKVTTPEFGQNVRM